MNLFKSSSQSPLPTSTIPGYTYAGCHTDSVGARVLADKSGFDDELTLEMCAAFCDGYTYFGAEYGTECYCGNAFLNPTTQVPEGDCSYACAGNATERCGAGNRLSLYEAED